MRIAGPDVVLFIVGALLFAGAGAAIVTTPGGLDALTGKTSALNAFDVTYATRSVEGDTLDVPTYAGEITLEADVPQRNVARVVFTIQCTDPVPAGTTYTLAVRISGPNNITAEENVSCGTAEIPVDVTSVPPSTVVQGRTEEEARTSLGESANATRGTGAWTLVITGSRSPNPPVGVPGTGPSGSVSVKADVYEPSFAPIQR